MDEINNPRERIGEQRKVIIKRLRNTEVLVQLLIDKGVLPSGNYGQRHQLNKGKHMPRSATVENIKKLPQLEQRAKEILNCVMFALRDADNERASYIKFIDALRESGNDFLVDRFDGKREEMFLNAVKSLQLLTAQPSPSRNRKKSPSLKRQTKLRRSRQATEQNDDDAYRPLQSTSSSDDLHEKESRSTDGSVRRKRNRLSMRSLLPRVLVRMPSEESPDVAAESPSFDVPLPDDPHEHEAKARNDALRKKGGRRSMQNVAFSLSSRMAAAENVDDGETLQKLCSAIAWRRSKENENLINSIASADVNTLYKGKLSPLHYAAAEGLVDAVQMLVDKGSDVNCLDAYKRTPLLCAITHERQEVAEVLLANGANPNLRDQFDRTPMHWIAQRGHKELAELVLTESLLRIDLTSERERTSSKEPLLHLAAEGGHIHIVKLFLLDLGFEPNKRDENGKTPYDIAADRHHRAVVDFFFSLDRVRREVCTEHNGRSYIQRKIQADNLDVVRALINNEVQELALAAILGSYKDKCSSRNLSIFEKVLSVPNSKDVTMWLLDWCVFKQPHEEPLQGKANRRSDNKYIVDIFEPFEAQSHLSPSGNNQIAPKRNNMTVVLTPESETQRSPPFPVRRCICWPVINISSDLDPILKRIMKLDDRTLLFHPVILYCTEQRWRVARIYCWIHSLIVLALAVLFSVNVSCSGSLTNLCDGADADNCLDSYRAFGCTMNCSAISRTFRKCELVSDVHLTRMRFSTLGLAMLLLAMQAFQLTARLINLCPCSLGRRGNTDGVDEDDDGDGDAENANRDEGKGYLHTMCYVYWREFVDHWKNLSNFLQSVSFSWIVMYEVADLQMFNSMWIQCCDVLWIPHPIWWQFGSFIVLLIWITFLHQLRLLLSSGIFFIMFIGVARNYLSYLIFFLVLLLGFSRAFVMLLPSLTQFTTVWNGIVALIGMFTGELNVRDTLFANVPLYEVTSAFFIFFIFIMVIVMTNLLTGLAMDEVRKMQEDAAYQRLRRIIEFSIEIEQKRKCDCCNCGCCDAIYYGFAKLIMCIEDAVNWVVCKALAIRWKKYEDTIEGVDFKRALKENANCFVSISDTQFSDFELRQLKRNGLSLDNLTRTRTSMVAWNGKEKDMKKTEKKLKIAGN